MEMSFVLAFLVLLQANRGETGLDAILNCKNTITGVAFRYEKLYFAIFYMLLLYEVFCFSNRLQGTPFPN